MIIQHFNYKDFKINFYSRIKDASVFDVNNVNYIKVIMDCLVVRYAVKGKISPYIFYYFPGFFLFLKRMIFNIKRKADVEIFNQYKNKKQSAGLILIDNGRKINDRNDQPISMYFHLLRAHLDNEKINYLHFMENSTTTVYTNEFNDGKIKEYIKILPLNKEDKKLISDLKQLYSNVSKQVSFTALELQNIKSGLVVFFESYRAWKFHLKKIKPSTVFILGHYHREGLILACKQQNIKVVEFQHGLIAEEDIFYVMPSLFKNIKHKALFSDKIFTYGDYWTETLKKGFEFDSSQIKKSGYYLYEDQQGSEKEEKLLNEFCSDKNVILITTQPALRKDFIAYLQNWIDFLKDGSLNYRFIVKIHPADKEEWYDVLKKHPNVLITRTRLEVLFKFCIMHVTSYSTTLYDALRYGVKNYSINFPDSLDYVTTVVNAGISTLIEVNAFPKIDLKNNQALSADYYFEKPDFKLIAVEAWTK